MRWLRLSLLAALPLLPGHAAIAGPPLPGDSSVDPCLSVCPAGDLVFRVIGRRGSAPEGGWPIGVDLTACPGVRLVPADGTEPYYYYTPTYVVVNNDYVTGIADFRIRAGGVCSGSSVPVTSPLTLATLTAVASPDQNGDLTVDSSDLAIATAKLGTTDPTADFTCDGAVTAADVTFLQQHLGHHWSGGATATRAPSWGRLKIFYR